MRQPDDPSDYDGAERRREPRYPYGNGHIVNGGNGGVKNWLLGLFALLIVSGMGWIVASIDGLKAAEAEHNQQTAERIAKLETKVDLLITRHIK